MDGDADENAGPSAASERSAMAGVEEKPTEEKKTKKKRRGVLSRIWTGVFGSRKDDFERRLERISREETAILNRMRRRAHSWGKRKRQIILISVLLELISVGYAITIARMSEDWKIRAFRVLPMFLLPAVSAVMYSALKRFVNMREQKDQKTLERLREERQLKIDELKEKTNYYITQQLIQRYDTDPAAKAAATAVLASKLGSDLGLKLFLENETQLYSPAGKSDDFEPMQSSSLRNRKQTLSRATSVGSTMTQQSTETSPRAGSEYGDHQYPVVDHYQIPGSTAYNGGWLSRIAALLVGEDPTQCYALICGHCHMHNGLASKEDFPYVTYICPHCRTVNGPKIRQEGASAPNTPNTGSVGPIDLSNTSSSAGDSPLTNRIKESIAEAVPLSTDGGDKAEASAAINES